MLLVVKKKNKNVIYLFVPILQQRINLKKRKSIYSYKQNNTSFNNNVVRLI